MFRTAIIAFMLATGIAAANTSRAAPIEFDFAFKENGAVVGLGSFAVDSAFYHGVGAEFLYPLAGLLSLDFTIYGVTFDMDDDFFFPAFPTAIFLDGGFAGLAYYGKNNNASGNYILIASGDGTYDFLVALGAGDISFSGTIALVPEPSILLTCVAGLIAIGGLGRGKKSGWRR
jgi:hypothetical protein